MNQESSSIIITNSLEFEQIIANLKESLKRIKDSFDNETNFMKKIDNTDIWTGEVQNKVYLKYKKISNCYEPVIESLSLYIRFLENVINDYKKAETSINQSIENNLENIDVN